jgi:hypothetical protein
MNNWCIYWVFTYILLEILMFKWFTARHLYKLFGLKGLTCFLCIKLDGCRAVIAPVPVTIMATGTEVIHHLHQGPRLRISVALTPSHIYI